MSVGAVAHRDALLSMELLGTQVAPLVREEIANREVRDEGPPTNTEGAVSST
jgi:hypothetical protein